MPAYLEYPLEDGTTILVEVDESNKEFIRASNQTGEPIHSQIDFKQAFANVKGSIKTVIAEFDDLHVEEAEIKFGLKAIGEAGVFAIGKVGGEMNYEVTLRWKKNANS